MEEVEQLRWELEEAQDELARLQQAIGFRDLFSAAGGALRPLASTCPSLTHTLLPQEAGAVQWAVQRADELERQLFALETRMRRLLGHALVAERPEAADEVARLCDELRLALGVGQAPPPSPMRKAMLERGGPVAQLAIALENQQHAGRAGAGQAAANPQRRLTWGSQAEQQKQDEGEEGEGEEDEGGEDDYYLQPVAEGGAASPQQHEQADEEADVWGGFGNADGAAGEEAAQFLGFPAMAGAEAATPDLLGRPASPQPEGAAEPGGGEEQAAEQGPADAPGGGAPHLQLQQHLPENNGLLANNEQQPAAGGGASPSPVLSALVAKAHALVNELAAAAPLGQGGSGDAAATSGTLVLAEACGHLVERHGRVMLKLRADRLPGVALVQVSASVTAGTTVEEVADLTACIKKEGLGACRESINTTQRWCLLCALGLRVFVDLSQYLEWSLAGSSNGTVASAPSKRLNVQGWQYASSIAGSGARHVLLSLEGSKRSAFSVYVDSSPCADLEPQEKLAHLEATITSCKTIASRVERSPPADVASLAFAGLNKTCEALLTSKGAFELVQTAVQAICDAYDTMGHPALQAEQQLAQDVQQLLPLFMQQLARFRQLRGMAN